MGTNLELRAIELFDNFRDSGFTSSNTSKQIAKLLEEVGEFIEAIIDGDNDNAVMEAGDVAWLLVDMLHVIGSKDFLYTGMLMSLDKLFKRHAEDKS